MKRELIKTKDGSHSIFIAEMDEQYHSKHGSIVEAKKVYLEYGLEFRVLSSEFRAQERHVRPSTELDWQDFGKRGVEVSADRRIKLLEMGFGTGLNALLSYQYARENSQKIDYYTIEKYPLTDEEVSALNYSNELNSDPRYYYQLHQANWEEWESIGENFRLYKTAVDLREAELPKGIDLVYFDAFAPEKQPHLWREEIFQKIYDAMNNRGILTTYCVKGEVRRTLQKVGFQIEKLPGPLGGKREVLRAVKK